jgi:hypothetical protein
MNEATDATRPSRLSIVVMMIRGPVLGVCTRNSFFHKAANVKRILAKPAYQRSSHDKLAGAIAIWRPATAPVA